MFRTVPLSIIRRFSFYTQQWYMSYMFGDSLRASCQQTFMTYTIAVCKMKNPDDGQRNCPKHVEFYSKNKFEKLVHLVGFIIRVYLFFHLYVTFPILKIKAAGSSETLVSTRLLESISQKTITLNDGFSKPLTPI